MTNLVDYALLRSQLREVVLHEFVALRLEADGDRTASHRKTRVALIVDPQRHLLATAEKTTGVLRLGKRQLIVQRHATAGAIGPEPQQRFERHDKWGPGFAQRLSLLILQPNVRRRIERDNRQRPLRRVDRL